MAKRFTDTELWDKEWFMKLSPKLKCLVKMVRDKADLSGVWSPNWTIANAYIGERVTESDLLKIDEGNQFIKIPTGKIFCVDFIQFQYGSLSENSPVHRKVINLLTGHNIDYKHPINRVQEEEEYKDKEEVKEKDKEEEGERSAKQELIFPFTSEKFMETWGVLIKEKKWKGKSINALQASLKLLSEHSEQDAIEMMLKSIAGGYQGVFPLDKKQQNGKTINQTEQATRDALRILQERKDDRG